MLRLHALVFVMLAAPAPAPAPAHAAPRCPAPAPGERFGAAIAFVGEAGGPLERALRVCDSRTGRVRVLARARQVRVDVRGDGDPVLLGSSIEDVAVLGDRVAWTTLREGRRRAVITVAEASATTGRERRRFVAVRTQPGGIRPARVEALPRGALAWLVPTARDVERYRLILQRAGGPRRVLEEGPVTDLALERPGTVVWRGERGVRLLELVAPPRAGGCPVRPGGRAVLDRDGVLVTEHRYGHEDDLGTVLRACDRATGGDPVVSNTWAGGFGFGFVPTVAGATGRWVVLSTASSSRYEGCGTAVVRAVEAGTGRPGRRVLVDCRDQPESARTAVATTAGVPAWLARSQPDRARLLAAGTDSRAVELDAGAPGAITGLRAEGAEARWLKDGAPRSAALP